MYSVMLNTEASRTYLKPLLVRHTEKATAQENKYSATELDCLKTSYLLMWLTLLNNVKQNT